MKARGQLLRHFSRLATFDASCGLQMALGVKGKWKKRQDGGQDYPGEPETAQMHKVHSVAKSLNVKDSQPARRAGSLPPDQAQFQSSVSEQPGANRFAFRTGSYYFIVW